MIERAGLAGIAVWSAPLLTVIPAYASSDKTKKCKRGIDCTKQPQFCKPNTCVCATDSNGKLVCVGCLQLDCPSFASCTKNSDCPKGSACLVDACCDTPICVPKCGKACPPSQPRRVRSWAGVG